MCDDAPNHVVSAALLAHTAPVGSGRQVVAHLGCTAGPPASTCSGRHAGTFTVCANCVDHTKAMLCLVQAGPIAVQSPWVNNSPVTPARNNYDMSNEERISTGPNAVSPSALLAPPIQLMTPNHLPNPPWGGFLTRVCDGCERLIQSEVALRMTGVLVFNPAVHGQWQAYPSNACTCRWKMGLSPTSPTHCYTHQRRIWDDLEEKKDANDSWLRDIALNPQAVKMKRLMKATQLVKTQRRLDGTWRACRCGAEILTPQMTAPGAPQRPPPEALMCMACEGYFSIASPLARGVIGQQPSGSRYDPSWNPVPGGMANYWGTRLTVRELNRLSRKSKFRLQRKTV